VLLFHAKLYFLANQTGVSIGFTHAGNFIWYGGFQMGPDQSVDPRIVNI
jgi:hypothetical protein